MPRSTTLRSLLLLINYSLVSTTIGHRITRSDAPRLEITPTGEEQKIQAGKSIVFHCMGSGQDSRLFTDLTWYDPRGQVIRSNNDFSVTLTNTGDKKMLVFKNPKAQDAGTYTCKARFQNTISLEVRVNVKIYEGISWKDCPTDQSLVKGQHHEKIRCTASSKPKADITWLKDDQPIDSARYASETDGIRIRGPSAEMDSGRYTVMAAVSETGLLELRDIVVQTHVRPTIIDLPEFEQAVEGDKVKLSCKAQAVPHAVYSWIDPNNRNLSTVPGYSVNSESGDLIIDFVDKERDRGSFKCIASNAAGQDEKSVNMRITTRPVITRLENVSSIEGGEAVLTCIATGNPAPRLIFKREGEENRELFNGQQRIRLDSWDKDSESRLVLTVSQVDRRDSGLYFCRAENVAGFREQASHLQVEFRPDLSRTQTVVKSWQGNTVNITCLADAIPNATIKWYDFRNRQIDSDMRDTRYKVFNYPGESKLQIVCSDNAVYTNYKCQASNQHGDSEVIISLQEATVPDMVSEVILVKKSPQSLAYKITPPLRDGGLPVIRFHVKYTEIQYGQASQDPRDWRHHSWPANAQVYYIDNLRGRTAYELRFAAENEVGKGPESEMVREELPDESQPEPVQIIQDDPSKDPHSGDVLSRYSRSFTLKWTEPQDNGRKIESYEIKYYKVKRSESFGDWTPDGSPGSSMFASMTPADELTYTLSGLQPTTYYKVEITAKNSLGHSHPTTLVFRTADYNDADPDPDFGGGFTPESSLNLISATQVQLLMGIFGAGILLFFLIMDVICCCSFQTGLIHWISQCCSGNSSKASASSSTRRNLRSGSNSSVEGEKEDPMGGFDDPVDQPLNRHQIGHHHQEYQQQIQPQGVSHFNHQMSGHNQQLLHHNNGHNNHHLHNLPAVQTTPIVVAVDPSIGSVV